MVAHVRAADFIGSGEQGRSVRTSRQLQGGFPVNAFVVDGGIVCLLDKEMHQELR